MYVCTIIIAASQPDDNIRVGNKAQSADKIMEDLIRAKKLSN